MKYPREHNKAIKHTKECCDHYGLVTHNKLNYNIFTCIRYPDLIIAMRDSWEFLSVDMIDKKHVDPVWQKGIALMQRARRAPKIKWLPLDIAQHSVKVLSKRKIKKLRP